MLVHHGAIERRATWKASLTLSIKWVKVIRNFLLIWAAYSYMFWWWYGMKLIIEYIWDWGAAWDWLATSDNDLKALNEEVNGWGIRSGQYLSIVSRAVLKSEVVRCVETGWQQPVTWQPLTDGVTVACSGANFQNADRLFSICLSVCIAVKIFPGFRVHQRKFH